MSLQITTLFWDVGGVLLSNGWDTASRQAAAEEFGLDWEEFQERHSLISAEFERGRLDLEEYLDCTVFHRERDFSREKFREFIFRQSRPREGMLELAGRLARSGRYLMATLNNESRDLNLYRIETFGLREHFTAFFSSCFLGVKKPERRIYETALEITQRRAGECLFIDDRPLNLETARRLGMHTVHFRDEERLIAELQELGIEGGCSAPGDRRA